MFNLIVAGNPEYWDAKWVSIQRSRFLGYTTPALKERYEDAGATGFEQLTPFPSLFMPEGTEDTQGWIGEITQVRSRGLELGFTRSIFPNAPPITWGALERVFWELDINPGERTHTHWAVKEADLIAVLQTEGIVPPAFSPIVSMSLGIPRPARAELLAASKDLEQLGHADFDRLILELGVDGLSAGRDLGGLAARANAVGKFALENPDGKTAEGGDLWREIVNRAAQLRAIKPGVFRDETTVAIPAWVKDIQVQTAIERAPIVSRPLVGTSVQSAGANKVFLVHGRESGTKHEVARFLERIGLEVTILHERANKGRTLISKFQEESADIAYAVVLMTPDDQGGLADGAMAARARQNVVFELGFFIGRLGADRVCAIVKDDVEKPSDFDAVVYVQFDPAGAWKGELARELKEAGLRFDPAKVFS